MRQPNWYQMKKNLLSIVLLVFSINVYAQTVSYGIDAGLNLSGSTTPVEIISSPSVSIVSQSASKKYITGFHAGVLVDFRFNCFSVQPGVLFSTKGSSSSVSYVGNAGGQIINVISVFKLTLDYIEVPLNLLYRINVKNGNVFMGAGPYVGLGVSAKAAENSNQNGQISTQSLNVKFGSNTDELRNPDLGFNGLIGYKLNLGVAISAGFSEGFVSTGNSGNRNKNQGFRFSADYFFK